MRDMRPNQCLCQVTFWNLVTPQIWKLTWPDLHQTGLRWCWSVRLPLSVRDVANYAGVRCGLVVSIGRPSDSIMGNEDFMSLRCGGS